MQPAKSPKVHTPLGYSLLSGLVGNDKECSDFIDHLRLTTRTPIEAAGVLYRTLAALLVQCIDGGLHPDEVRDCGVVLEVMVEHFYELKGSKDYREIVQHGAVQ